MSVSIHRALVAVAFIGSLLVGSQFALAQVPVDKQSVITFDIQMQRLRSGTFFKKMSGDDALMQVADPDMLKGIDLTETRRLIGSVGCPKSLAAFGEMGTTKTLPLDFFVRALMSDEATTKSVFANFAQNSRQVEKNGKTYLYSTSGADPENVSVCAIDTTTIEMGTDFYTGQANRAFGTKRLRGVWVKMPDAPIRIAIDAKTAEAFIDEAMLMAAQSMPPQFAMFLSPVQNIATVSLAVDLESETLVSFEMTGKDEQAARTLEATLNGMLTMGKASAQQSIQQAPTPAVKSVLEQLVQSLVLTRDGATLSMTIPRPKGFDDAMINEISKARTAAASMRKQNDLRQVLLSMHNHHAAFRKLPWKPLQDSHNKNLSWRYRLLPFMEEQTMYETIDREKGPNEAPNSQFANQMPKFYGPDGKHSNIVCILQQSPNSFAEITDGLANTIALIQVESNTPWLESPGGITIADAVKAIRSAPGGKPTLAGMYDGSIRMLDSTTDEAKLRAMMTISGGEQIE